MIRVQRLALSLLLCLAVVVPATSAAEAVPSLGRIDFPNSGAEKAQPAFIRGVLFLHSFEYEDARDQQRQPDVAGGAGDSERGAVLRVRSPQEVAGEDRGQGEDGEGEE